MKEKKRIIYIDADGWIHEERKKEIKTTNEVGLVMIAVLVYT